MAGSVNKVILVGNLGKDPEIRHAQDGNKIASFSIATSERWKDKNSGEYKDRTEWHRIVVFNENLATIIEKYIKKGTKLYVEGALQSRKYTGTDGIEKNITEVILSRFRGEIVILDNKGSDNSYSNLKEGDIQSQSFSASKNDNKSVNSPTIGADLDDEIPF